MLGQAGLTSEFPSGAATAGAFLNFPTGEQYTSYRTGDEGWRRQNGFYNPTNPLNPSTIAQLDYTLGSNYWWQLKYDLKVNGVSNKLRFVDIDGGQTWSATGNKNKITIDKLTGLGFYRINADLGVAANWNTTIDNALAFSVVVNGITYSDFYLASREEFLLLFGEISEANSGNIEDNITTAIVWNKNGNSTLHWTSTTQANSGGTVAYYKGYNPSTYLTSAVNTSAVPFGLYIFDARTLITA